MTSDKKRSRPGSAKSVRTAPGRVADRYEIQRMIGRGGTACVYSARDWATRSRIALKLLRLDGSEADAKRAVARFEHEYRTLVQLAHPGVIQTYDYGLDHGNPYYTMELLDGGDLHQRAPLPWRRACAVAYEIGSVLALLHSRRLVHLDLTPRNIRLTSGGKAKLIDFGLLSPIGRATLIAGTPPFVPPEMLKRGHVDGRSDLFSLGATLYYALTRRSAYPARRLSELEEVWRKSPVPPSRYVVEIPPALDELVLALLRIDAGSRPKSAAEVMNLLLPLLDARPRDEVGVASAHLVSPRLIARDEPLARFRRDVCRAHGRRGGGVVIAGQPGTGRTRMLDAFALEAKLAGFTTLRASSEHATAPFGVAAALAAQLRAAEPLASRSGAGQDERGHAFSFDQPRQELVDLTDPSLERTALQVALRDWLLAYAKQQPLAIVVDDIDCIDEPSAALLASLTWEARRHRLIYAVSLDASRARSADTALSVFRNYGARIDLLPLGQDSTTELLASVFGDVPHLQALSRRLFPLCAGRPRECMVFAQFLVDQGAIRYSGGSFSLPAEIPDECLPASIEHALEGQLSRLSPLARRLAALLGLGLVARLSRTELALLPGISPASLDEALHQLRVLRVITGDTHGYALCHTTLAGLLGSSIADEERSELHDLLADVYARSDESPIAVAFHLLQGRTPERGLDHILARASDYKARVALLTSKAAQRLGTERMNRTFELALERAVRSQRPWRDMQAIWVLIAAMSAQGEDTSCYRAFHGAWCERLKNDTGWDAYRTLPEDLPPMERALCALRRAAERYAATPEAERVLSPGDALKQLATYVVFALAVSVRVLDLELMASLPPLLEPFAVLSPFLSAMLVNARGTLANWQGRRERARALFIEALRQLEAVTGNEVVYVERVRAALSQSLAEIDASLGVNSVWIERIEHEQRDPNQLVGARYVRKIAALARGNWEEAESHRQAAELLMLQNDARPMFSTLTQELEAHAMARDLTGVRQVRDGIQMMAERHPGWKPVLHVADAQYLRLCGDLDGALAAARAAVGRPSREELRSPWPIHAFTVEVEILSEIGRALDVLPIAEVILEQCDREDMRHLARGLAWAVALGEAKLGDFAAARTRIARVIAEQLELGISGLLLGRSYELSARIALWSGDASAFERFSRLTAEQYRPGESSVLGALYERLMEQARELGLHAVKLGERNETAEITGTGAAIPAH